MQEPRRRDVADRLRTVGGLLNEAHTFERDRNDPEQAGRILSLIRRIDQRLRNDDRDLRRELERERTRLVELKDRWVWKQVKAGKVQRTPVDVLVHLLHEVRLSALTGRQRSEIDREIVGRLRRHNLLTVGETRQLLDRYGQDFRTSRQDDLAQLTTVLQDQLPAPAQPGDRAPDPALIDSQPPARLHDNPYGRVLDTAFIDHLVDHPPQAVVDEARKVSRWMASWIRQRSQVDQTAWRDIAWEVHDDLTRYDVRFWFGQVAGLAAIRTATGGREALDALTRFLDDPGDNGPMAVAIPYLVMEISLGPSTKDLIARETPWRVPTGSTYNLIEDHRARTNKIS